MHFQTELFANFNLGHLCQWRFRLNIRKIIIMEKFVKQWNRLPVEVEELSSPRVFKRHVGIALRNIVVGLVVLV